MVVIIFFSHRNNKHVCSYTISMVFDVVVCFAVSVAIVVVFMLL